MHGDVFKDGSRISATFKMELFSKIGNVTVYSQCTVALACCFGNSTIFTGKIKIGSKWPCLEGGINCDFLFLQIFENENYFVSLTFCFISKINYKNENWYYCSGIIVDFIFRGFIIRNNHQHMFWKMLRKCRKSSCERVLFLKKNKGWHKFILHNAT